MNNNLTWKKVVSPTLPNLHVLCRGTAEVGFIYKPRDTKFDTNAWRLHKGIGNKTVFLGHEYNKGLAMKQVETEVNKA